MYLKQLYIEKLTLEKSYILGKDIYQKNLYLKSVTLERNFAMEKLHTKKSYAKEKVIP